MLSYRTLLSVSKVKIQKQEGSVKAKALLMLHLRPAQKIRLENERKGLERNFQRDKISWTFLAKETYVEVEVSCTNKRKYVLRVHISNDFPNSCPSVVVISPNGILRRANGSFLRTASRNDHVLPSKDGFTQICHFRSHIWMGDATLSQVVKKGVIWLEAYELHLQTGDPLDKFLQAEETLLVDGVPLEL